MANVSEEDRKKLADHAVIVRHLGNILGTDSGKIFFKYFIENFSVGEVPEFGLDGNDLHDKIGFLRASKMVFELMSQANQKVAADLFASVQKEKYERLYKEIIDG